MIWSWASFWIGVGTACGLSLVCSIVLFIAAMRAADQAERVQQATEQTHDLDGERFARAARERLALMRRA